MKKLIFPFLFFWINVSVAQNYQNICSPGITYYTGQQQFLKAFRQDSSQVSASNDTLFYSYRTTRDSLNGPCKDTTNGDALGRRIWKRHDGWFWFFNMKNDTLKLNSQAALNESWKYCSLPGNAYLLATVTGIITDSVLGTTDLVKVITFQAKDASNNNIPHIFNGKQIKISQHYGLSKVYDIYWTPFDTLNLVLTGKTTPPLGAQPFTWAGIYDFNVGDEFHYYDHETHNGGTAVYSNYIHKILGKTVYGNMDSVYYQVEECKKTVFNHPPPNTTQIHDTIIIKYNFIQLATDNSVSLLPDEYYQITSTARTYSAFNGRPVQVFNVNGYGYGWNGSGTCITNPFEVWGPVLSYVPGLGLTNSLYEFADQYFTGYYSDLVYYKQGPETWGTPVALDCSALLGADNAVSIQESSIEVFPNPAGTETRILLHNFNPDKKLFYTLFNYSGTKIKEGAVPAASFILNRSGLPSGLYILTIYEMNGMVKGRTKITFN